MHLWGAETVSQLGSQSMPVVLPLLAALTLDATPFQMGLLATFAGLPTLLFGFIAGAWVDRLPRRTVMLGTDAGRALVLLAIPAAAMLDVLSIGLLIVVSFVVGIQTVFFNAAYVSLLPVLVDQSDLVDANGKLYSSQSVAQVAAPAFAGMLVGWFTGPIVVALNSVTFAWSAWFLRGIRTVEPPAPEQQRRRRFWHEVGEGVAALWSSPILRATTLATATINLAGYVFLSVYVLYMAERLNLSATGIGLVFAAGGVGALIGSILAPRLPVRYGLGRTLVLAAVAQGAFGLTVPLAVAFPAQALPLVVIAECMQWLWLVVFFVNVVSLRQAITPNRMLGRVSASNQVITGGMAPVGSFLGGVIGSTFGVETSLVVGIAGMFLAAGWIIGSPVGSLREFPASPVVPATGSQANAG